jgi:hypothetical protein
VAAAHRLRPGHADRRLVYLSPGKKPVVSSTHFPPFSLAAALMHAVPWRVRRTSSQFALKRPVEDRREQGVEFGWDDGLFCPDCAESFKDR